LCNAAYLEELTMADDNKNDSKTAAEAPAKVAETVANTAQKIVDESAKTAKRERATTARRAKRQAAGDKKTTRRGKSTARKTRTAAARTTRTTRTAARKTAAAANQGFENVTSTNFFNGLDAAPAFAPFQNMFANVNGRGQELTQRSQKVAEELANLTRSNVEAMVEASRVAAQGARSLGQDMIAASRDNVEQAADAVELQGADAQRRLHSDGVRGARPPAVLQHDHRGRDPGHASGPSAGRRGVRRVHLRSGGDQGHASDRLRAREPAPAAMHAREGVN
jgi:hypothetical protein